MMRRLVFFFFKQKTAYEISSRDWSSDVCSSDLREIPARDASSGELSHERVVGDPILGDDEQAGGVLVQTVDDARASRPADAGDRGRVGQERGGEGATRVTGARMDDDAGWLVE